MPPSPKGEGFWSCKPVRNCSKRPPCQRGLSPKVTGGFKTDPHETVFFESLRPRIRSATSLLQGRLFTVASSMSGRFFAALRMTHTCPICHSEERSDEESSSCRFPSVFCAVCRKRHTLQCPSLSTLHSPRPALHALPGGRFFAALRMTHSPFPLSYLLCQKCGFSYYLTLSTKSHRKNLWFFVVCTGQPGRFRV